jgi:hypothetical protein
LDLDRILAFCVRHDALRVLFNCFGHFIFIIQPRPCWRARRDCVLGLRLGRLTSGQSLKKSAIQEIEKAFDKTIEK